MRDLITISKKVFILLGLLALAFHSGAQVPEKFNYQLAVRDAQGNVVASQQVSFRVSIMQGSTVLFQETHITQTTANGLVNLLIGDGTPAQGSMAAIDWGGDQKSLKVEFDPAGGSSFADLATTPLLSVPYALHSKYSEESAPGGTNMQVQFNNAGSLGGSDQFIFSPLYNRVGIGTLTPEAPLHVQSNGEMSVYGVSTRSSGSSYGGYFKSTSSTGTGVIGTSQFFGVVGEAIAASGSTLGGSFVSLSTGGTGVLAQAQANSGTTYGIRSLVSSDQGYSGFFVGGKFYISGRTGIGTDSPEAGLHLKGEGFPNSFMYIQSNVGQDAGFRIYEGPNVKWSIFNHSSAGGLNIYNTGGNTAIFAKYSNAYVGIGNTTPSQALDVNGNARFRAIGSGAYAGVVNRTADGTLTTSTSDIRFKENIQTLQGGLDKILQLRGVNFTWKDHPEYGTRIGFIAQEFEKVIPELVFTNETDGFKGINYAEVSAVLVEAIKEQQTQIDRLQQENLQLNARLERLERALESLSEN